MAARVGSLLLLGCLTLLGAATAAAQDDAVIKRLTRHGDLGKAQANQLAQQIGKRMKRSADMTQGRNDPLRMEVNKAVLGTPVAPNTIAAAKVRLRLYAGLNEWALEKLFAPRPGVLAACEQLFGVSQKQCQSLVAAAGKVSLAQARKLGAGEAQVASGGAAPAVPSRFRAPPRRFTPPRSRFGGNSAAQRAPAAQPAYGVKRAPAARPQPVAKPTRRVNTKEEYQRRRQAYLERQRKRMEERKAKLRAASGPAKVDRGPASEDEAKVAGVAPPAKSASSPEAAKDSGKPEKAAAAPAKKPAMDDDFLNGLLADPLGGD